MADRLQANGLVSNNRELRALIIDVTLINFPS